MAFAHFKILFISLGPLESTPVSRQRIGPSQYRSLRRRTLDTELQKGDNPILLRLQRRENLYRSLSLSNTSQGPVFSPIFPKTTTLPPPCRERRRNEVAERRRSFPLRSDNKVSVASNLGLSSSRPYSPPSARSRTLPSSLLRANRTPFIRDRFASLREPSGNRDTAFRQGRRNSVPRRTLVNLEPRHLSPVLPELHSSAIIEIGDETVPSPASSNALDKLNQ